MATRRQGIRITTAISTLVTVFSIAACGTPEDPDTIPIYVSDIGPRDGFTGNRDAAGGPPDAVVTIDLNGGETTTGEPCGGIMPECIPSAGVGVAAAPYCSCEGNADCASGLCVQTASGKVCSEDCVECCPEGFTCQVLASSCPDCRLACLPNTLNLCRPCTTNAECENPYAPAGERCVTSGSVGSFCAIPCGNGDACPTGYVCGDISTVDGSSSRQCLPESGACDCSPLAIAQGAQTTCASVSEIGSCPGKRVCTPAGLGPCEAPIPSVEECDGKDNDCDGLFDEGTCSGDEQCACNATGCACGCPPGLVDCGGGLGCIDPNVSVAHCGDCDSPCQGADVATFACQDGQCAVVKCAAGREDVDGIASTGCECTISDEVCDGKDNDCDGETDEGGTLCSGEGGCVGTCGSGECTCDDGCDACGGTCIPMASYGTDAKNCGYCGNACALEGAAIHTCNQGTCCAVVCATGRKDCNKDCTDGCEWEVNPESCDGIDNDCNGLTDESPLSDCGGAKVCVTGKCQCDPTIENLAQCGSDACVDLGSDPDHCGICGNDCDQLGMANVAVTKCVAKECAVAVCKAPWVDVDGESFNGCECQKTSTAELCNGKDDNCNGVIDEQPLTGCSGAKVCSQGSCICDPAAQDLAQCLGDECVDVSSDADHCGGCGSDCDLLGWQNVSVTACLGKTCQISVCTPPWVDVDGQTFNGCECEKTATAETCDGKDNNCDGVIDTFTEACSTLCGTGVRSCSGGEWSACNAKQPIPCKNYQSCQDEPVCLEVCPEIPAEKCNGFDDNCNAKTDEGFLCSPGDNSTQACGNCGSQPVKCNAQCQYDIAGACTPGGICTPGASDSQGCGLCGTQSRTCTAQCGWSSFGQCQNEGTCAPGSQDSSSCGKCGTKSRGCANSCQWGDYGACQNEGTCSPSETSSIPCGLCGIQTRTCTSSCGWGGYGSCQNEGVCSPGQSETQPCGNCGFRTRACGSNCQWGGWTGCSGEGVCAPGTPDSASCGNCGSKTRTCTSTCQWGNYGSCSGEGACAPSTTKSESCGSCGTRQSTCTSSCQWGAFGTCQNQGVCSSGDTSAQSCGNCGTQSRTCSASCAWGSYGTCTNQGACAAGQTSSQNCGNCGTQSRSCSGSCQWGTYGTCTGQGVCSAGTTSSCPSACGSRTCSGSCGWGSCNYTLDSREPNDTYNEATLIGSIEEGGTLPTVSNAWLHSSSDFDRYYFICSESGDIFDGTFAMSATLSGVGGTNRICIYYDRACNGSVDKTSCAEASGTLSVNTGDQDAQNGSDDDGCIDVEVTGAGTCSAYTLQFGCN